MELLVVLAQRADHVRRYIEDTGLPFNVLIDESREVAKRYGVWHRVGLDAWNIARPAAFLIDRAGIVRSIFVAERQDEFPTQEEIVDGLKAQGSRLRQERSDPEP